MIASKETLQSLGYRLGSIGMSFVSVSLLVKSLGPERYGAWATLVSALVWVQMTDFGVGYVVKNRVATLKDRAVICQQIAAAVYLSTLISLGLVVLYAVAGSHISIIRDYPFESTWLYLSAFLALPAMLGINILQGMGMAAISYRVSMMQALGWLLLVVFLGDGATLRVLAIGFAVLWLLSATYAFWRAYRALDLNSIGFGKQLLAAQKADRLIPIIRVGGAFFLLQLTSLVLFNLGTYLAYTYFSAEAAARYDVLNKVFQIPMTLFNVVISIVWATIAQRLSQGDHIQVLRIQHQLLIVSLGGGLLMAAIAYFALPPFVHLYSHKQIEVSQLEVASFAALTVVQMVAYTGAVFMNAAERLKLQIGFALAGTLTFLPLFRLLEGRGAGIEAVPLATLVVLLPSALYFNVYVRRHIIAPLATT